MKPIYLIMPGIFLIVLAVYMVSPVTTSMDSLWSVYLGMSFAKNGDFNLDEYSHIIPATDYRVENIKGHLHSTFPIGTPLMAAPIIGFLDLFMDMGSFRLSDYLSTTPPNFDISTVEKLVASVIVAINAVIIFALAMEYLDLFKSILLTAIFAFATSTWSTASRALWQHGPSMLCLSLALYLVVVARRKPGVIPLLALPLTFSYIVRPTNSISIALFTIYVFFEYRKYFLYYVLGMALCFAPFLAYNYSIYSQILPPYYSAQRLGLPSLKVMLDNLFSPSRGLFIFSPILLLSLFGMYRRLRSSGKELFHKIDIYLFAAILFHWVAISAYGHWYGGWSIGPRFFSDMIPYFIYFLIPILEVPAISGWSPTLQSTAVSVFLVLLVFSTFVQFRCATDNAPLMWNGIPQDIDLDKARLQDWSDIQFLRGLCPDANYKAPACWFDSN